MNIRKYPNQVSRLGNDDDKRIVVANGSRVYNFSVCHFRGMGYQSPYLQDQIASQNKWTPVFYL